mmetsp:Transcript_16513/g.42337  ORF Transcript_16513/g.42337 Transcript_16513/m.42337 type:complete len:468 (-) Transcript_16513:1503-2906(-)
MASLAGVSMPFQSAAGRFLSGRDDRKSVTAGDADCRVLPSAVMLTYDFEREATAERMDSRSATTPSQSESTRATSLRTYSRYDRPPICSDTQPATLRCASRRDAAYEWPLPMRPASSPERVSSTICLKRCWSSRRAVSRQSRMMSSRSAVLSDIALPRSISSDTGSGEPLMEEVMGETLKPPVLRSMRSVSSTKLSVAVPISVRHWQKSGTRGMSSAGTGFRSSPISMYSTSLVNSSWCSRVEPSSEDAAVGMVPASLGISSSASEGMHLSASGLSGVSWRSLRALVFSMICCSSASDRPSFREARRSFSAFSTVGPSSVSGSSWTVTQWLFSSRYFFSRGPNTFSPLARRALNFSRSEVHCRGWKGSRSYSQEPMERSISDRPRGNRPVLFSRKENSMVFIAASAAVSVKPLSASSAMVVLISSDTLSMSSGLTPLRPMLNIGCRSSSSSPPPMMASPRPLSMRAL